MAISRGRLTPTHKKRVANAAADPLGLFVDTPRRDYPRLHQRGQEQAAIDHFELMAQAVFDAVSKGSTPDRYPHKTPEFREAVAYVRTLSLFDVFEEGGKVSPKFFARIADFLYRRRFGWKVALPGIPAPGPDYEETER